MIMGIQLTAKAATRGGRGSWTGTVSKSNRNLWRRATDEFVWYTIPQIPGDIGTRRDTEKRWCPEEVRSYDRVARDESVPISGERD